MVFALRNRKYLQDAPADITRKRYIELIAWICVPQAVPVPVSVSVRKRNQPLSRLPIVLVVVVVLDFIESLPQPSFARTD